MRYAKAVAPCESPVHIAETSENISLTNYFCLRNMSDACVTKVFERVTTV